MRGPPGGAEIRVLKCLIEAEPSVALLNENGEARACWVREVCLQFSVIAMFFLLGKCKHRIVCTYTPIMATEDEVVMTW